MARVLVVDDEAVSSFVLAASLSGEGHEVRTALHAKEALRIAGELKPDVLVCDWKLRGDTAGIDIARLMLEADPALKVILYSGLPREEMEREARGVDVFSFFEKPCDVDEMLEAVRTALCSPRRGLLRTGPISRSA